MKKSDNVDPTMGKEFFTKCLVAVAFASLLMVVYIAFRFRKIGGWSAGAMCVVALVHDMIWVFAAFLFLRIPLNDNFIAAALTILGYSINNTIVIYDRVRENKRLLGGSTPLDELVNVSINQTFEAQRDDYHHNDDRAGYSLRGCGGISIRIHSFFCFPHDCRYDCRLILFCMLSA